LAEKYGCHRKLITKIDSQRSAVQNASCVLRFMATEGKGKKIQED